MGQVTALRKAHAHDGIARLEHREVDGLVRLRAGVGLDVGMLRAEQLAGTVTRDILGDIDRVAAAVVTLRGVSLGVLVGEYGAHRRHDSGRNDVLAGDQLEVLALTGKLLVHRRGDLFIILFDKTVRIH